MVVCHAGTPEQAEKDLAPLLEFGPLAMAEVGPMPYSAMNTLLDDGFPRGALNYWKSSFLRDLDDGVIDTARRAVLHRAVADVGDRPRALSRRSDPHSGRRHGGTAPRRRVQPRHPGRLAGSGATDENVAWARETYRRDSAVPRRPTLRQLPGRRRVDDAVRAAYGPNYDRLVEVKTTYDPENVFHLNQNIDPSG